MIAKNVPEDIALEWQQKMDEQGADQLQQKGADQLQQLREFGLRHSFSVVTVLYARKSRPFTVAIHTTSSHIRHRIPALPSGAAAVRHLHDRFLGRRADAPGAARGADPPYKSLPITANHCQAALGHCGRNCLSRCGSDLYGQPEHGGSDLYGSTVAPVCMGVALPWQ